MFKHSSFVSRRNPVPATLHSLLQQCSSMNKLKQLHAHLLTTAHISDTHNFAALIAFCSLSPSGDLHHARNLFETVPSSLPFIWNTLIRGYSNSDRPRESLLLHKRMLTRGILPNNFTLPFVLKACASESALTETKTVHGLISKLGFGSHIFVSNALLHAYSVCGEIASARRVFDELSDPNVVSWNSIIGGYCRCGDCWEAFALFREMRGAGFEPDRYTFASLLSACSQKGSFQLGRMVHQHLVVTGADMNVIVGNALVDMYGKCGELHFAETCFNRMPVKNVVSWTSLVCAHAKHGTIDTARRWFDQMPEKSIVSWNAMISGYVRCGMYCEGLNLYAHMRYSGVTPDEATLASVLSACGQTGDLSTGKKTHDYVRMNFVNPDIMLLNSIVDMYAKCGYMDIAFDIFNTMARKNAVSWNVIIGALAMHGNALDAIERFELMVREGFIPDGITFTCLLSACSHGGLLETGRSYFESMNLVYKVPPEIEHYACMAGLLGRRGHLEEALELIRSMPMKPDVVIWGALLGACRIHGDTEIGEQVMKPLLELEQHNGGLYVLMSNMYSEDGRWEDVKSLRVLMKERRIIKDKATSLIEINGCLHEFLVQDTRHAKTDDIYLLLDQLTDHLLSVGRL